MDLLKSIPHRIHARNVPRLRNREERMDLAVELEEHLGERGLEWGV
jgi:hypothetical protein